MHIGVDASPLAGSLTGVGNYVLELLRSMHIAAPETQFHLVSNKPIVLEAAALGTVTVSAGRPLPGPVWMNSKAATAFCDRAFDAVWFTNGYMPLTRRLPPSVLTIHDLTYRRAPATMRAASRLWRRALQPRSARRADRLVAVSHATSLDVTRVYGRTPDSVIHPIMPLIYRPQPSGEIERVRTAFGLPERYLLTLGTREPRKNLESLVRAIVRLDVEGVHLPPLAIVGGEGWRAGALDEAIAEGERRGLVRTLGFVAQEELPGLYAGASLFILASLYEGFGMPALEAQLCGAPVAISSTPALLEATGGYALTMEPTVSGIAAALRTWAQNPESAPIRPSSAALERPLAAAERMLNEFRAAADRPRRG